MTGAAFGLTPHTSSVLAVQEAAFALSSLAKDSSVLGTALL